jgi:hypothetical protein
MSKKKKSVKEILSFSTKFTTGTSTHIKAIQKELSKLRKRVRKL